LLLGQRTLEVAALLSIQMSDTAGFQRNVSQLKAYYAIPGVATKSNLRQTVLGLYLLFLIVENRLAEFHSELELMTSADLSSREIAFSISLEQFLMVGTYNQVLAAKADMPAPEHFSYFMGMLLDTVRDTIAECAESAYDSLDYNSAREMMMFGSDDDLGQFIKQRHSGWDLVAGRIFWNSNTLPRSQEIQARRIISENLTYATELERIV